MRIRRTAREWATDLAVTGVGVLLGAFLLLGELSDSELRMPLTERLAWEAFVGGAASLAVLLFRRSRPVALALVMIPFGLNSSLSIAMTALAMFGVAVHRSWRVTAAVGGTNAAVIVTLFSLDSSAPPERLEGILVILLMNAVLLVTGMLVRSQRQLVGSLRERARQAEEEQRLRVEEARHLERERIAREMHDVLAHRISLLAVHAGALEYRQDAPESERRAAGVIRQCAYEAMEDLREVLGMLRQDPADPERPQPTLADLPRLIEESRAAGADIALDDRLEQEPPPRIGRHVYRIVQEGLTNVRKHAPGAGTRVALGGGPATGVTVEVRNALPPGPAHSPMPGAGAGLIGLRERIDLLGGRLEHGPTQEADHLLRAWLPWSR
ncbi:histidine kinase [Actinomadura craniellae]|uniref:histidine kinase n=1 Tax=Actinomadura craniellae TaxID=2231787 RepID=A0A365H4N2_9ACTN|nr:histidine kinase [Actinomadura craniellae]RAY14051.1 histidine kinase [Actinomadura craniellae]